MECGLRPPVPSPFWKYKLRASLRLSSVNARGRYRRRSLVQFPILTTSPQLRITHPTAAAFESCLCSTVRQLCARAPGQLLPFAFFSLSLSFPAQLITAPRPPTNPRRSDTRVRERMTFVSAAARARPTRTAHEQRGCCGLGGYTKHTTLLS